ncbi:Peptidyl-tRNA hydrolase 2, mitochondrial [Wickerhamiella sorbophila]|uniref:peptidyl-tRNA hydrolase n=1 Tax=Wickerhamiella sorbophila TaxID=45607 RepID=A0A2T0FIA6_9ASCO|nr:Peptidyl-tRNA hydrolase 2, mitochondrial [Wickerhamiella sorbophila]PRT54687.1 Peptidyl-tRNA hydrolase 2, mitochondrial [Wickerhamiella sorbophila]
MTANEPRVWMVMFLMGLIGGYVFGRTHSEEGTGGKRAAVVISGDNRGEFKMVLVVRRDLPMTKGKVAAQCAHAALACYEEAQKSNPDFLSTWKKAGQAKITLQCDSEAELRRLEVRAARLGVTACAIVDAGRTQIDPGTTTVLGVGPAPVTLVNEITGHLKLY